MTTAPEPTSMAEMAALNPSVSPIRFGTTFDATFFAAPASHAASWTKVGAASWGPISTMSLLMVAESQS